MIKLGIIGMSPGNAHPYSWSAIVNGSYDSSEIMRVGYSNVAEYLDHNKSDLGFKNAHITHIWTQDQNTSKSIAQSSSIENIVDHYSDLIGEVDAVIIARDDPENHRQMAQPFIEADVPLFVDKPLAADMKDLHYFKKSVEEGRFIMSCSSMRYAVEIKQALHNFDHLGEVELAVAVGKKDWIKYGVHMLEAVFTMLGDPEPVSVWSVGKKDKAIVRVEFSNGILATVHLFMNISSTFQIYLHGTKDFGQYEIKDSYQMFKANLEVFIEGVKKGRSLLPFKKTYNIVRTVIGGIESQEQGKKVFIKSL